MKAERRPHLLNLPEWELPHLDDLEFALVEELAAKARWVGLGSGSLKDALSDVPHDGCSRSSNPR